MPIVGDMVTCKNGKEASSPFSCFLLFLPLLLTAPRASTIGSTIMSRYICDVRSSHVSAAALCFGSFAVGASIKDTPTTVDFKSSSRLASQFKKFAVAVSPVFATVFALTSFLFPPSVLPIFDDDDEPEDAPPNNNFLLVFSLLLFLLSSSSSSCVSSALKTFENSLKNDASCGHAPSPSSLLAPPGIPFSANTTRKSFVFTFFTISRKSSLEA
mmetsp:Transcript_4304/g.14120  ORF Transcript_4304/g.14120 Transcript_4304/m.14120 type:complete len:214 (+) Transcript_4304:3600-4241(+)